MSHAGVGMSNHKCKKWEYFRGLGFWGCSREKYGKLEDFSQLVEVIASMHAVAGYGAGTEDGRAGCGAASF